MDGRQIADILNELEMALLNHGHYRHADALGQLKPLHGLVHPQILKLFPSHSRVGDRKISLSPTKSLKLEPTPSLLSTVPPFSADFPISGKYPS